MKIYYKQSVVMVINLDKLIINLNAKSELEVKNSILKLLPEFTQTDANKILSINSASNSPNWIDNNSEGQPTNNTSPDSSIGAVGSGYNRTITTLGVSSIKIGHDCTLVHPIQHYTELTTLLPMQTLMFFILNDLLIGSNDLKSRHILFMIRVLLRIMIKHLYIKKFIY